MADAAEFVKTVPIDPLVAHLMMFLAGMEAGLTWKFDGSNQTSGGGQQDAIAALAKSRLADPGFTSTIVQLAGALRAQVRSEVADELAARAKKNFPTDEAAIGDLINFVADIEEKRWVTAIKP
jgi:hypothetical protein